MIFEYEYMNGIILFNNVSQEVHPLTVYSDTGDPYSEVLILYAPPCRMIPFYGKMISVKFHPPRWYKMVLQGS